MTKNVCNGSQAERFKALKVGDQVASPGGGEIWDVEYAWRPGRLIGLRKGRAFRSEDPADMERLKWMVVYGPKRTSNSTNAVVRNAVAWNASDGGDNSLGKFKSDFSKACANLKREISRVRDSAKAALDEFFAIKSKIGDDVSKMTYDLSPDQQKSAVRFCEFMRKNSVKAHDFWRELERNYVIFDK